MLSCSAGNIQLGYAVPHLPIICNIAKFCSVSGDPSLPFLSVSMVTSQEAGGKMAESENTLGLSSDNNCGHPLKKLQKLIQQ